MIVVDTEFTGLDPNKNGIWQIGAIDLESMEEFLEEARIDDEDETDESALKVVGKREQEIRNPNKQSQKQLITNFFNWVKDKKIKNMLAQGPWDFTILLVKARKYNLELPFHHRSYDLHSIASLKHFQVHGKFLIKEDHSDLGLTNMLTFCGMQDNRQAHNALEDCKLEAECFSRIVHGKNLFKEFEQFPIPDYLKKE